MQVNFFIFYLFYFIFQNIKDFLAILQDVFQFILLPFYEEKLPQVIGSIAQHSYSNIINGNDKKEQITYKVVKRSVYWVTLIVQVLFSGGI